MDEQVAELQRETRSSIELKRNAKGEYAWDIKIYFEDKGAERANAVTHVEAVDDHLRKLFLPGIAPGEMDPRD